VAHCADLSSDVAILQTRSSAKMGAASRGAGVGGGSSSLEEPLLSAAVSEDASEVEETFALADVEAPGRGAVSRAGSGRGGRGCQA
jgi:hypothetical protein